MRSIYLILELSHIQCLFYGKYFGFQVLLLESAIFRGSDESLIEVRRSSGQSGCMLFVPVFLWH